MAKMQKYYCHQYAIELAKMRVEGRTIVDIAKVLGVDRSTVYNWLDRAEVKAEMDKLRAELHTIGKNNIAKDLNKYIDNIKDIANNSNDARTKLSANVFLIESVLGKNTSKLDINANFPNFTHSMPSDLYEIDGIGI